MPGLLRATLLGFVVTANGCVVADILGGETKVCTLIGCANGVVLTLTGAVPQNITVDATGDDGTHRSMTCTGTCTQVPLFDFHPAEATISISWSGGSRTVTIRPTYESSRPNGPDCPPVCVTGRVTVDL